MATSSGPRRPSGGRKWRRIPCRKHSWAIVYPAGSPSGSGFCDWAIMCTICLLMESCRGRVSATISAWGDKTNMDKNQKVSLGCGTLILIALIVILFGNAGRRESAEELHGLRQDVQKLEKTVTAQTRQIESLELTIQRLLGPTSQPAKMMASSAEAGSR
jgi:hypothetical protein